MPTKIRLMPTLLHKDVGLVKGVGFNSWRRVGSAMQAVKVYNLREVDELVFLDISATRSGREPDFDLVHELALECFVPLSVGGGIRSVDDVRRLLQVGADKVVVNTTAIANPGLVSEIASRFGTQCVIASIDARRHADGSLEVFTCSGTLPTGLHPVEVARRMEEAGAGEILITSIDRDGSMHGYDINLVRAVADGVSIPVIASGGAGSYQHLAEALHDGGASALAAASIFHFTEQTPLEAKRYLAELGFSVRN